MAKAKVKPKKLLPEESANPMERYHFEDEHHAIQNFFSWFNLEDAHELLFEFFRYWIVYQDKVSQDDHFERDRRVFFYEQLCIIVEACLLSEREWVKNGNHVHCVMY